MSTNNWGRRICASVVIAGLAGSLAVASSASAAPVKPTPIKGTAATMLPAHSRTAAATDSKASVVTQGVGYALVAGPHLRNLTSTEWDGTLNNGGTPVICSDYDKFLGLVQQMKLGHKVPGLGPKKSRWIFYLINHYVNTHSKTYAAALNDAVNLIRGKKSFVSDWHSSYVGQLNAIDPKVVPLVSKMKWEAKHLSGGKTTCQAASHTHPGQSGSLDCEAISATKHAVAGVVVSAQFKGTNRTAGHVYTGKTNKNGHVSFAYVQTSVNAVSWEYTTTMVQWKNGEIGQVSSNYQKLLGKGTPLVHNGSGSYSTTVGSGSAGSVCNKSCNGNSVITYCAPANAKGAYSVQYSYRTVGSKTQHVILTVKGGQAKTCVHFAGIDEMHYRFAHRIVLPHHKFSPWKDEGISLIVDCPPWVTYTFSGGCKCPGGQGMTVNIPANAHPDHAQRYILDGVTTIVPAGQSASVAVPHTGHETLYVGVKKLHSNSWVSQQVLPV